MLQRLWIRDFAVVDSLGLEFRPGFTALTGETGAGKSILIDALALALGERSDADQVRAGGERAEVAAEFSLEDFPELQRWLREQALEGDPGQLLLRRVVDRNGRSRAFVNGHAATLAQLREAGDRLVDIHGQHAHQSLLKGDAQRQILDSHGGLAARAQEVAAAYREWQRVARSRREYESHAAARAAERDQLAWQVEELSKLALAPGEWEAVQGEQRRLAHAASLIEGAQGAIDALSESDGAALDAVSAALARLRPLLAHDPALGDMLSLLDSAQAQLIEAVHALRHYAERIDLDPERLRSAEERLQAIHGASRRFRVPPEALPELLAQGKARLAELAIASDLKALEEQERLAASRYRELARALSTGRKKAAARLAREVTAVMKELAMADGAFEIALRSLPEGSSAGNEEIEFLVATNAGFAPRPLAKVASGGELSRISLAIQVITSKAAAVPTLIFDEVDAGIGGAVAEVVGTRLRRLGEDRQVLCVTHLPQVAARAREQWSVAKSSVDGEVRSHVRVLDEKGRIEEIARMLGGVAITATTRRHAAEMIGMG
ncbi:MAG: DNA repair protein RecN [Betaproteobacteria bacterium]|nr:DNA repair protein RecN [Betaproteobacteria bacterium]MBI2960599.1 DNA repair protein RecN [Betaproteobacteria bacterium]